MPMRARILKHTREKKSSHTTQQQHKYVSACAGHVFRESIRFNCGHPIKTAHILSNTDREINYDFFFFGFSVFRISRCVVHFASGKIVNIFVDINAYVQCMRNADACVIVMEFFFSLLLLLFSVFGAAVYSNVLT